MLLPTRVPGRRSKQSSSIGCSKHRLPADGTQYKIGRHKIYSYACTILSADGVPTSWDSNAIGSGICHSIAGDHISIKKFVQHAT